MESRRGRGGPQSLLPGAQHGAQHAADTERHLLQDPGSQPRLLSWRPLPSSPTSHFTQGPSDAWLWSWRAEAGEQGGAIPRGPGERRGPLFGCRATCVQRRLVSPEHPGGHTGQGYPSLGFRLRSRSCCRADGLNQALITTGPGWRGEAASHPTHTPLRSRNQPGGAPLLM